MSDLADSQEKVLLKLKQKGPQTARTLAEQLGISTMGVRQHLSALEAAGYVEPGPEQQLARGRPVRPWQLTEKAQQRFPDAHSQVTVELIAAVRDTFGSDALDTLIDQRGRESLAAYRDAMANKKTLAAQLRALVKLRSQEGYMADLEKGADGEWLLIENHCPICAAATACQGFCRSELEIFQTVLQPLATVERTDHILRGARRCAYKIVPHRKTA